MQAVSFDPNALMFAAFVGLCGFFLSNMQNPGRRQERLVWMAIAAGGAYVLRQIEGRANQSESQAVMMAALETRIDERFKTAFNDIADLKATVNRVDERIERAISTALTRSTRRR